VVVVVVAVAVVRFLVVPAVVRDHSAESLVIDKVVDIRAFEPVGHLGLNLRQQFLLHFLLGELVGDQQQARIATQLLAEVVRVRAQRRRVLVGVNRELAQDGLLGLLAHIQTQLLVVAQTVVEVVTE
jgi:hypothetical protein